VGVTLGLSNEIDKAQNTVALQGMAAPNRQLNRQNYTQSSTIYHKVYNFSNRCWLVLRYRRMCATLFCTFPARSVSWSLGVRYHDTLPYVATRFWAFANKQNIKLSQIFFWENSERIFLLSSSSVCFSLFLLGWHGDLMVGQYHRRCVLIPVH
jgi:hypothetical protein